MPSEADSADQGAATPKPTAPVVVRNLVLIPLIGIGLTAWAARGLDFSHIHLHSIINDQFDYVTGARNLLRTGNWERNFIAPSLIAQPYTRNAMYVPGHFAILAAFYAFFGYGVWQSILPNLVSFAKAPLLIYLTGIRLWNHRIAWLAVLIFWANPFHRLFALTAMSESTFVAATALSLCIFVYLRDAWKPWLGPLCLVPPFLCRESGAVIVLLFVALVFARSRRRWRDCLILMALSILVLGAIFKSPLAAGRPSFMASNFVQFGGDRYRNALDVQSHQATVTTTYFLQNLPAKICRTAARAAIPGFTVLFPPNVLADEGFRQTGSFTTDGKRYLIYEASK